MRTKMRALIVTAAALLASGGTMAQGYVGAAIGASNVDFDCSGLSTCDRSGIAAKVFGGYKFTPHIAIEGTYFSFGKAQVAFFDPGLGNVTADLKAAGLGIGAAFFGQFSQDWSGVARVGVASIKSEIDVAASSGSGRLDDSKAQPYFGLGVGYALSKSATLDVAADFSRAEIAAEKADLRALTVGVTFSF